ncbi:hypothetical protein [Halomicrobium salinisoli]|uniref:hypothetical protein n=1 Tax=Halomicrobium salinisoli TaxID=2878391 RepID=UPI001CF0B0BE|nr:hypothetical protein [Halomicrobium salinisoli]
MARVGAEHVSTGSDVATYEDVKFLEVVLDSGERHVWDNGKHYVEHGRAEAVSEGDAFYFKYGRRRVSEVVEIKEDESMGEVAVFQDGTEHKLDTLTGDYEKPMGDPGPPPKMEERPFE